jgi:uncharacterized membrane protein
MTQPTAAGAQTPAEAEAGTRSALEWLGILGPIAGLAVAVVFLANTSWYDVWKTIHVLGAIVWLGGGAMITLLAWRARRAKDDNQLLQIAKQAEWLSVRVFVPSSLVVVAMGFVLMHNGHWGYANFWPLFGLVAWSVSFLVGATFLGPEAGRLGRLIEVKGPDDPQTVARVNRIISVARADVVLLLLIAADMVAKPFFG